MATIFGFNSKEDVDGLLRLLAAANGSKGRSVVSPSSVRQEARYAKILTVFNNSVDADNDDKEATGVEVAWDSTAYDFAVVGENPVKYDNTLLEGSSATVFSRDNISSQSKMVVNDIVLLQQYPHLSETSGWLVVETGGTSSRAFVIITSVIDATNYIGNVLTSPTDVTVLETDVAITIRDATQNELVIGDDGFADLSGGVYYLEGALLG